MNAYLKNELNNLGRNISCGVRLAFFGKSVFPRFIVSMDQAVFLVAFNILLYICVDYWKYLPDPLFNAYALADFSLQLLGLLLTAFVLAKIKGDNRLMLAFIVHVLSITPLFCIAWPLISELVAPPYDYYVYLAWVLAVVVFILAYHANNSIRKTFTAFGAYSLLVVSPAILMPYGEFWYSNDEDESYADAYNRINQENVFYAQHTYLNQLESTLLPGRPGISDLYFIGFAGYASEDVFMKEIHYIQELMDDKFDTRGRSVSLINNPKTLETTPLATKSNLALVLQQIGQKMNRDEDVLFLYLTSHGSRTHELSVSFWPLSLNQVTPEDLRTALDQAGIKWRVLLVSACYSGGFLEQLKNSTTLVMTAAAADKTSFGCGAKSDFTYFGQEVFKGQLAHSYSFIPAFETAMANIAQREKRENLQPSMPQLYVGPEVGPKLEMLEKELRQFYADSSAHYMN